MLHIRTTNFELSLCALLFTIFFSSFVSACSVSGAGNSSKLPLGLVDPAELPFAIKENVQRAARLSLHGKSAVGLFVDSEGRFLTSSEIIGPSNCAKEGCFVDLHFQVRGKNVAEKMLAKVRAVVSGPYESSIVDLYKLENGEPKGRLVRDDIGPPLIFQTAQYDSHTFAINYQSNGRIIAVPFAESKEGSDEWKLAGNARFLLGAPLFNRMGHFIGVVAQESLNVKIQGDGYLYSSQVLPNRAIGTALSDVDQGSSRGMHLTSLSEKNAYRINPDLYLHAEKSVAIAENESIHMAKLLKSECARQGKPDGARACRSMLEWINCNSNNAHFQYCPDNSERDDWVGLFEIAAISEPHLEDKLAVVAKSYRSIYSNYSQIQLANRYCNFAKAYQSIFDSETLIGWSFLFQGKKWPRVKCNGSTAADFLDDFFANDLHLALPDFTLKVFAFNNVPILQEQRQMFISQIVDSDQASVAIRMQAFFMLNRIASDFANP